MADKSPKVNLVVDAVARKLLECGLVEPKSHSRRKVHELSAIELAEHRLYKRQAKRERRKDPEFSERERERQRQAGRERRKDPEYRERHSQYLRERYQSDPDYAERIRQASREWRRNNPEQHRANHARRRARKAGNVEPHPDEERWAADPKHHVDAKECFWCGEPLGDDFQVDHVLPIALGGRHIPTNLVRSCPRCNLRKSDKHPDVWSAEIGWGLS